MHEYNLGFIKDRVIFEYVKKTVLSYSTSINLEKFNKNIIDPIKLTFDSKVYGKTLEQTIQDECIRQIDKANNNQLGYFHQNLFGLLGNGWKVLPQGFDIVNEEKHIFVEMKSKHNTMNASDQRDIYLLMQNKCLKDEKAVCMLVEVIAKQSQNIRWEGTFKGEKLSNDRIKRVSIDKFYEMVTGDKYAFVKLCKALPVILDDVIEETGVGKIKSSVLAELELRTNNIFKSLYLLAFNTYEGFNIIL